MKTMWEKIYSFLGFLKYTLHVDFDHAYRVYYLWVPILDRKIDLLQVDVSKENSINSQKKMLLERLEKMGEEIPPWLVLQDK